MAMTPDLSLLKRSLTVSAALGTLGASTLAFSTVAAPAFAASPDYFDCTVSVTDSGVSEADAIAACSSARYPENLGACVVDVNELTGLAGNTALAVCSRSRRPTEVADCTINIHDAFLNSPSTRVLENCGRSLMPARYGTCVVDIVDATEVAVDTALTQCIRAGYRPWQIMPRS